MRSSKLTTFIFVGMILGIVVGYMCNKLWPDPATAKARVTEMADKLLANPVIESYRVGVLQ